MDARYRRCATCNVEWLGDPPCWLCARLCPPVNGDDIDPAAEVPAAVS